MYRKFIALIVASAVAVAAVAASSAPARADSQEVAKVLAGLAALAILGAAISDSRDNDVQVVTRPSYPQGGYYPPRAYQPVPPRYYQPVPPRPLPPAVSRYDLPAECLSNFTVRGGSVRLFGARCLQNKYRHAAALPRGCQREVRAAGEVRLGYEPSCLRDRGYRQARN